MHFNNTNWRISKENWKAVLSYLGSKTVSYYSDLARPLILPQPPELPSFRCAQFGT